MCENILSIENKKLAREWHPFKNGILKPNQFKIGSHQKVWWLGKCNHEWETQIYLRHKGSNCPYCANKKVLEGFNDLNTANPELVKEWHPVKNELKPTEVTIGSDKTVWWIGKCGHEWDAKINSRKNGSGCPYCSNKKVLQGFNDLATTHPELEKEWDYKKNEVKPTEITYGAKKRVYWNCKEGHEWDTEIRSRRDGNGCPVCSGHKKLEGFNDLITTNPELAKEWNHIKNGKLKPTDVSLGTDKKVWWLGKCGHEWEAQINHRKNGSGCPYCSNKKVLIGFNDLITTHPQISKEWHVNKNKKLKPTEVTAGSDKTVWWLGECGHEWFVKINSRKNGSSCPKCANERKISIPEKTIYYYIKNIFPEALENYKNTFLNKYELDIYIPSLKLGIEYDGQRWHKDIKKDLDKNRLCKKNKVTLIRIREPKCVNLNDTSIDIKLNDLKEDSLKDAINGIIELINKKFDLDKSLNIDISKDRAEINDLITFKKKENSLKNKNHLVSSEWHPSKNGNLKPENVTSYSGKKVWWLGKCNHEWEATISKRTLGQACPYCSNKKILIGYNDLGTTRPDVAAKWNYKKNILNPTEVSFGSNKKIWWECNLCNHEWESPVHRLSNDNRCPSCKKI